MRIEFNPESETAIALAAIIGICEREIQRRHEANDVSRDEADAARRERYAKSAGSHTGVAAIVPTNPQNLPRPLPAGSGVKSPALIGIDPNTGEIDNDANAARQAFGGNPSLPSPGATPLASATADSAPPTGTGVASPATTATAGSGTAPDTANIERDKSGIPWDERIHSRERTKNKDGSWRDKRGVDAAVRTAVLAEIAGTISPVEPPAPSVPTPPPTPPVVVPVPPSNVVSLRPGVPVPPAAAGVPDAEKPVVVPQPPVNPTANGQAQSSATAVSSAAAGASPSKLTFPALVSKINQGLAGSKITQDDIQLACSELGIAGVAALADPVNAHLTDAVAAKLFPQG
jgi:hypothetical protein